MIHKPTNGYRVTIVIGIIVVTLITVAVILGLELAHIGPASTPAIASILGFTAPTVAALFALLGIERVKVTQNGIHDQMATNAVKMADTHTAATEAKAAIADAKPLLEVIAQRVREGKL